MDKLLNELNELTEKEQKQVLQFLNKKKPSIQFSKATLDHCVRLDGLALNINLIRLKAATMHIPDDFVAPTASAHLCEALEPIFSTLDSQ